MNEDTHKRAEKFVPVASAPKGRSGSSTLLTVVVVVIALYFARVVFIPLALSVLLAFLLAPMTIRLRHIGVARAPAAILVVTLAILLVAIAGSLMTTQLADLARRLPEYQENIRTKMHSIRLSGSGYVNRLTRAIQEFSEELRPSAATPVRPAPGEEKPVPVEIKKSPFSPFPAMRVVLGSVVNTGLMISIVVVFALFILMQREDLRDRLIRLIGAGHLHVTTEALDDAATRVSRYLLAQFALNTTYGILIAIGLYYIGVPNPLLWGLLALLLRYVPYLGIWIAAIMPAAIAFAVDPGWLKPVLIFALFFGTDILVLNFLEPVLYGSSTGISPMAILVAAIFWTWLWGPVGLLLATPLTVCLVVLGRYVPQLEFLSVLLGDEPVLSPEKRFYQRMLAMDLEEATEVAEDFVNGHSLEELFDKVIVPALSLAEEARHQGRLEDERQQFIFQNTRLLVEDFAERSEELTASPGGEVKVAAKGVSEQDVEVPSIETRVLCIPARDEADEIGALMLAVLLRSRGVPAKVLSSEALAAESLEEVASENAHVACVTAIPPYGYTHVRYLCKRLQAQFPDLKIVAAILTERDVQELKERQPGVPADQVATNLKQTQAEILALTATTSEEKAFSS